MSRKVFDRIASVMGGVVVVVLLVAGGLLMWGHSYTNNQVRTQLSQQQIFFPAKAAFAHPKAGGEITPSMIPSVSQYAGQQLLTGQQAQVWANDFMAVHLYNMPYHGVYANISAAARAAKPGSAQATSLAALEQTSFQGTTLRGMLLNAYAFWKMGQLMLWGAIASFALALIMAILVGLGLTHASRTEPDKQLALGRIQPAAS